jgi:hypothetical protein
MKKVILALLIITIAPLAYSQELEFGLKAGLSSDKVYLSNLGSLDASVEGNTTYNFGAYGRLKIILVGLYVQPELMYNKRASNITVKDGAKSYTFSHSANYLDVPVLVGLKMFKIFRIYGGPNFQFLVGQKTEFPSDVVAFKKSDLNKSATGGQIGIGLDLAKIRVDAKYDFNLGNMGTPFEYNGTAPELRNGMITLQVGFKLFGLL